MTRRTLPDDRRTPGRGRDTCYGGGWRLGLGRGEADEEESGDQDHRCCGDPGSGAVDGGADHAVIGITVRAEEVLDEMWAGEDRQCEEDDEEDKGPDGSAERDGR